MARTKAEAIRAIGLDLSITSPGFALIDVTNRKPTLVAHTHYKTDAADAQTLRHGLIESYALFWLRENLRKGPPVVAVAREIWPPSRDFRQNDKIHGTWSAVDRALAALGLAVTDNLSPTNVKKAVTGSGKAEKSEIAAAVRRICGLPADYTFATDDESDAAAVALAYLITAELIDRP
ncbi:crossover junction endodeoxyribonuclease RuvC [Paenibacillus naphthalenovorans]|uniref:crossover junction endodeoxyribonuclease RuvC n=1 Tax=Paenibacillus naphthalenovorans TaxID=162209 RepID=UPI003D2A3DE2